MLIANIGSRNASGTQVEVNGVVAGYNMNSYSVISYLRVCIPLVVGDVVTTSIGTGGGLTLDFYPY